MANINDFEVMRIVSDDSIKLVVKCKDNAGDIKEVEVPECNVKAADDLPLCYLGGSDTTSLCILCTDVVHALALASTGMVSFWSKQDGEWIDRFDDEYYDEDEDGNGIYQSTFDFFNDLFYNFTHYGYVYACMHYVAEYGYFSDKSGRSFLVMLVDDNHEVIMKGARHYSCKYAPGDKMFYHKDGHKDEVVASTIDEVRITQGAGRAAVVRYKMCNGVEVPEALMATKDMVIEWANSRS